MPILRFFHFIDEAGMFHGRFQGTEPKIAEFFKGTMESDGRLKIQRGRKIFANTSIRGTQTKFESLGFGIYSYPFESVEFPDAGIEFFTDW